MFFVIKEILKTNRRRWLDALCEKAVLMRDGAMMKTVVMQQLYV